MIEFKATRPSTIAPQGALASSGASQAVKTTKPAAQAPMPAEDNLVQSQLPYLVPDPKGKKIAP
jgi:hypothetical protein